MVDAKVSSNSIEGYAYSCFLRAQRHMENESWAQAVAELKEAIKGDAQKSKYHALLGLAYFNQKLNGMARVYIGQALKLNPSDELASLYASKLNLNNPKASQKSSKQNFWLKLSKIA